MTDKAAPPRLVIDRRTWLRGEGGNTSSLLRAMDGKMCCLGFLGIACGFKADTLAGHGEPAEVFYRKPIGQWASINRWPNWLVTIDPGDGEYDPGVRESEASSVLMAINDDELLADEVRERKIAAAFARHGIRVEFVGDASASEPSK